MENTKREVNEKFNEEFNLYLDNLINSFEVEKSLCKNTDYIDWLEEFTTKYPSFSTEYFNEDTAIISERDKEMINKLDLFYNVIESHAKNNYIDLSLDRESTWTSYEYVVIKYKDNYYRIGFNQMESICFVSRTSEPDIYLDFNLVINNNLTERAKMIRKQLISFRTLMSQNIEKMIDNNVPYQVIDEEVKSVLVKYDKRFK